ncbi:MAG: hypothetical protein H8E44_27580 [Planctomycetes bacterium]|nr:hypothetical protein [Planctomycetota bacterium]MBL7040818.1 hypothetical protein [Pirellulaceae bacterium]
MTTSQEAQPDAPSKKMKPGRMLNIALRTAHIGVTSVLFGGHVLDVKKDQLLLWLYLTIATGAILAGIEAYPRWRWFYQGRGAGVLGKMALLCLILIPQLWAYRVPILVAVIVIASVGAHMPARYRYYSFVHGRVLDD